MEYQKEIIVSERLSVSDYIDRFCDTERFLACCRACPAYGKVWSCPPFSFNPLDRLKAYRYLYLVGVKIVLSEHVRHLPTDAATQQELSVRILGEARRGMDTGLLSLEQEYGPGLAFFAGSCSVCARESCSRREGLPCRYPRRMRSSLESYGFDISRTALELLGVPLQWSEGFVLPEYFFSVGGLFTNRSIPFFRDKFLSEAFPAGEQVSSSLE